MAPKLNSSKRKTGIRRTIAKSINLGTASRMPVAAEFITLPEQLLMAREEMEQTTVDKFWGIDKDLKDRNAELLLMSKEVFYVCVTITLLRECMWRLCRTNYLSTGSATGSFKACTVTGSPSSCNCKDCSALPSERARHEHV
jgi:hypothetical protein